MRHAKRFRFLLLGAALTLTPDARANRITELDISAPDGFSAAPRVEVYSTDGEKWNAVDSSAAVTFTVKLKAECQYEGKGNKAYEGDLSAAGFAIIGDTEPADFLIPHSGTASATFRFVDGQGQPTNPVEICNTELNKRLASNAELTRYHVLGEGFTLDYPGAFEVKYRLYCHATGLGKTDLGSDTTLVNALIHCGASDVAKKNIPPPPPRAKPAPARQTRLVREVAFAADRATVEAECPVTIRFNGSITTNRAGTVRYRYVSHDGRKSPELSQEFAAAGTQATRAWSRTLSKPQADTGQLAAPNAATPDWDHQGWYRLDILDPKPQHSVKASYKVRCRTPTPARATRSE